MDDVSEDVGTRCLVRAVLESRPRDDDEEIEEGTKRSEGDENGCDGLVHLPKITREGATYKQQGDLQHQRQRLHYMVEIPGNDAAQFLLSVVVAPNGGPALVGRVVTVQPLLAEHCQEGGKEGNGEAGK